MGQPLDVESMAQLALFLCKQGDEFLAQKDFSHAEVRLTQALSVFRELHEENNEYINWLLYNLGVVVLQANRQWEAENFFEASAYIQIHGGQNETIADSLTELGRRMTSFNAFDRARWLCGQAYEMYRVLGIEAKAPELEQFITAMDQTRPDAARYQPATHHFAIHIHNLPVYDLAVSPTGEMEWRVVSTDTVPAPLDLVSWKILNTS